MHCFPCTFCASIKLHILYIMYLFFLSFLTGMFKINTETWSTYWQTDRTSIQVVVLLMVVEWILTIVTVDITHSKITPICANKQYVSGMKSFSNEIKILPSSLMSTNTCVIIQSKWFCSALFWVKLS